MEGNKNKYSSNDVDGAYFLGVFNSGGIDALQKELKRVKKLGWMPHQFLSIIKQSDKSK